MAISCDFRVKFMQREQQIKLLLEENFKKLLLPMQPSVTNMTS
jgi:hypothetical protein